MVNNGRMVMQTDLDLHGHRLMNNNQGGFEIRDDGSIRCHGTFDLNGYKIDGVLSFAAGEIFFAKNINMNGRAVKHSSNLKYSINGTFDRDNNVGRNKSLYVTFDTLTYYVFSTASIIKDYVLDIQETDTNNVYDSHDILFIVKQYNLATNAAPATLKRVRKSHPSGRHYSHGDLILNMPNMSLIQIAIGKNYNGSRFDRASIKCARIALTIAM